MVLLDCMLRIDWWWLSYNRLATLRQSQEHIIQYIRFDKHSAHARSYISVSFRSTISANRWQQLSACSNKKTITLVLQARTTIEPIQTLLVGLSMCKTLRQLMAWIWKGPDHQLPQMRYKQIYRKTWFINYETSQGFWPIKGWQRGFRIQLFKGHKHKFFRL